MRSTEHHLVLGSEVFNKVLRSRVEVGDLTRRCVVVKQVFGEGFKAFNSYFSKTTALVGSLDYLQGGCCSRFRNIHGVGYQSASGEKVQPVNAAVVGGSALPVRDFRVGQLVVFQDLLSAVALKCLVGGERWGTVQAPFGEVSLDRKSTRLNSSH